MRSTRDTGYSKGRRGFVLVIVALTAIIAYQSTRCSDLRVPEAHDAESSLQRRQPSDAVALRERDEGYLNIAPQMRNFRMGKRPFSTRLLGRLGEVGEAADPSIPTSPPFRALNMTSAAQWLATQKETELRRASGILREQMEAQQKARVRLRERSAAQRRDPPAINCRCHGLSAMDQRVHWCPQENGESEKVSSAHVCVVENVCLQKGGRLLFISNATQPDIHTPRREFMIALANGVKLPASVVFRPQLVDGANGSKLTPSRNSVFYDNGLLFDAGLQYEKGGSSPSKGTRPPYATLAVLGHSAATHITHFLEPIGSLHVAVRDLMVPDADGVSCAADDLNCFYKPTLTVSNQAPLDSDTLWGQHILRAVYQDYGRKMSFKKMEGLKWTDDEPAKCFRKAVIPGTFYGIWPDGSDTSTFRRQVLEYLDTSLGSKSSGVSSAPQVAPPPRTARRIVVAHRTSKRTVVDHTSFVDIVRQHAATVGATVDSVLFGSMSFTEQVNTCRDAGILIGIHGADLTNMVFMPQGGVVVELNPLFFFENRFRELAVNFRLKYMPWNCGTHECAFGGNGNRFHGYMKSHSSGGLRYNYTDYTLSTDDHPSPFEWNWKGYVGFACGPCARMTSRTGIKNGYYSELRESNILFGPPEGKHAAEFRSVLDDAFRHLDWM